MKAPRPESAPDLTRLQSLDLSDNPLGVPPLVLGMERFSVSST